MPTVMLLCLLITSASVFLFGSSEAFSRGVARLVSYARPVVPESYSYVAEIGISWPYKETICTASLLSRSVMITAGHCLIDEKTKRQLGKIRKVIFRQERGRPFVTRAIGSAYGSLVVPEIEEKKKILDYALFTLEKPLPVCRPRHGRVFSIIKLPVKNIRARHWKPLQPSNDFLDDCLLLGYGTTEKGGPDGQLRVLMNVTIWEVSGRLLIPLEPKAVKKGRTCSGDSGGPLICESDFGERMYGIVSHSEPLVEQYPSTCHGEKHAFLYDVLGDVREMLPHIQESLTKMNKTKELIEDYERCDF